MHVDLESCNLSEPSSLLMTESQRSTGWKRSLAEAVRSSDELLRRLNLSGHELASTVAESPFPVLVPESYLNRMQKGDFGDPLLRQVLSLGAELVDTNGFLSDPVGDVAARKAPGLLQKYEGRALLIATGACAVHCRYCFRRHYAYSEEPKGLEQWQPALDQIASDASLEEIILSGGDPLLLSDSQLGQLVEAISSIEHIRRLRIHTRLPIVLPNRVTSELVKTLTSTRLAPVVVVHANHANELVQDCAAALQTLTRQVGPVLNQAVLLKGVNDSYEALAELSRRSVELGVVPYYLHQLDRVQGAAHFEVDVELGRKLISEMRRRLPGYLVPRYVAEIAGDSSKRPLMLGD
ncbi:MAG: EF-P beta-lysylation protein EpmB [Planctomycetaceae bacterium]|nr:EF-P beta-lysylation protein EpmB [Planctomycetaceae bacterium]